MQHVTSLHFQIKKNFGDSFELIHIRIVPNFNVAFLIKITNGDGLSFWTERTLWCCVWQSVDAPGVLDLVPVLPTKHVLKKITNGDGLSFWTERTLWCCVWQSVDAPGVLGLVLVLDTNMC